MIIIGLKQIKQENILKKGLRAYDNYSLVIIKNSTIE